MTQTAFPSYIQTPPEVQSIERRKRLADALQQQSMEPVQSGPAGGNVAPISWTQGLAKLAQAYAGNKQAERAQTEAQDLQKKELDDYRATITRGLKQLQGTPASPLSEDASGNVTPAQPAVPGNPMEAMATFGSHPMAAPLQSMAMDEMQRQRLIDGLTNAGAATSATGATQPQQPPQGNPMVPGGSGSSVMAGSGQMTPSGQPPSQPPPPQPSASGMGGPAGGVPLRAWIASDKTGKSYLEQLAKDYSEAGKPVINRGYGIGRMVNGQYVPDAASNTQAMDMERKKADLAAQYAPPHQVPTSSGQNVSIFPAEQPGIIGGNGLPARFGNPVGLGTLGISQPQSDAIRQSGQQASNTEAGREFIAEMRQNYAKLRDVPATLANIERGKALATTQAQQFMGPLGESRLALTKFFRANVPGMANLKTDGVTSAEELQSTLFNQVMDNLKKMDASPSQYQQQVMQEAFGTLRTDPQSVPKIMDVFSDILRNRVNLHNETVSSAEGRGTTFPYDVKVKLPARGADKKRVKFSELPE